MRTMLFEIGTEEIPARFLPPAMQQLKELAEQHFSDSRIDYKTIHSFATPRRLVLHVDELAEKQNDLVQEVKGPAQRVAFDDNGNPTKAALGFARGQGVEVSQLMVKDTPGGPYVFAFKRETGKHTTDKLPSILESLVHNLTFPKPMRWGTIDMKFARPIRWLVALYGDEVVHLSIAGVSSDRYTRGHRFLSTDAIPISSADDYEEIVKKNNVIPCPNERRQMILRQIQELLSETNGKVQLDTQLLEEIVFLLEYPTAFVGKFDNRYLSMPDEVVITPMKEHQRYFPVIHRESKELLPQFIGVRNGNGDHIAMVKAGNEKVLEARLADAKFFYDEDQKTSLEANVGRLKKIVFQEKLGTIYDKMERIQLLAETLATHLSYETEIVRRVKRAALLSKADLVTHMVYEFPELQGVMGEKYALLSGEDPVVAKAIFEHYLPRGANDILPETIEGALLSVADKIDTIVGCFAVGIRATGSQDPYALRRHATGICDILVEMQWDLSLSDLIAFALATYGTTTHIEKNKVQVLVYEFFEQRVRNTLEDNNHSYDIVEAIVSSGYNNVYEAVIRARALQNTKSTDGLESLLKAFNRVNNLAQKSTISKINSNLLSEPAECDLHRVFESTKAAINVSLSQKDYHTALERISELEEPINRFFDDVMVMADDDKIKANRLALLKQISDLIKPIADMTKIVL